MGIGGLDKEFSDIFRRAFASRVFPPDIVEQMGTESLVMLYISAASVVFTSFYPSMLRTGLFILTLVMHVVVSVLSLCVTLCRM